MFRTCAASHSKGKDQRPSHLARPSPETCSMSLQARAGKETPPKKPKTTPAAALPAKGAKGKQAANSAADPAAVGLSTSAGAPARVVSGDRDGAGNSGH